MTFRTTFWGFHLFTSLDGVVFFSSALMHPTILASPLDLAFASVRISLDNGDSEKCVLPAMDAVLSRYTTSL